MNGKSSRGEEREILLAVSSWDMKRSPNGCGSACSLVSCSLAVPGLELIVWVAACVAYKKRKGPCCFALEDVSCLSFLCLLGPWKGTKAPSAQESAVLPHLSQPEGRTLLSGHGLAEKQQCDFFGRGFTLGFTEQFTHCPYAAVSAAVRRSVLSQAENTTVCHRRAFCVKND